MSITIKLAVGHCFHIRGGYTSWTHCFNFTGTNLENTVLKSKNIKQKRSENHQMQLIHCDASANIIDNPTPGLLQ